MGEAHRSAIPEYLNKVAAYVNALPEKVKRIVVEGDVKTSESDSAELIRLKERYAKRLGRRRKPKVRVPLRAVARQYHQAEFLFSTHHAFEDYAQMRSACFSDLSNELSGKLVDLLGLIVDLRGEMQEEIVDQFRTKTNAALDSAERDLAACEGDLMYALGGAQRQLCNSLSRTAARLDVERFLESDLRKKKGKTEQTWRQTCRDRRSLAGEHQTGSTSVRSGRISRPYARKEPGAAPFIEGPHPPEIFSEVLEVQQDFCWRN